MEQERSYRSKCLTSSNKKLVVPKRLGERNDMDGPNRRSSAPSSQPIRLKSLMWMSIYLESQFGYKYLFS